MQRVFNLIQKVSSTNITVLIMGKSGTGKELVAKAIYYSKRSTQPFIMVNCGAIPETLIESELFGHKKGALTGSVEDKMGHFKTDLAPIFWTIS
jgi:transcriptional regulator with GAF, ATPase, and Fis domain